MANGGPCDQLSARWAATAFGATPLFACPERPARRPVRLADFVHVGSFAALAEEGPDMDDAATLATATAATRTTTRTAPTATVTKMTTADYETAAPPARRGP